MAYKIPSFPLDVAVYTVQPDTSLVLRLFVTGNLAWGKRVTVQFWPLAQEGLPALFGILLVPKASDVRDYGSATGPDVVEVPVASGRFYAVRYVDDVGGGFPNEHRFAVLEKLIPWPTPIPPVVEGEAPPIPRRGRQLGDVVRLSGVAPPCKVRG
jgi:hypothetical protein